MSQVQTLPATTARSRLATEDSGVLAFAWEGEVHAMPVDITTDDDGAVWFRSAAGVKLDAARAGARMAMCVHREDALSRRGWSVTARGAATVAPDGPAAEPPRPRWPDPTEKGEATWVRIDVAMVTGRERGVTGGRRRGPRRRT